MPETRGVPLEEMERNLGIELSEEDITGAHSGRAPIDPVRCDERQMRQAPADVGSPCDDRRPSRGSTCGRCCGRRCAASPVEAIDVMADGLATLHRSHVRRVPHHQRHAPGRRALRRLRCERGPGAAGERRRRRSSPCAARSTSSVLRRQQTVRMDEGGGERILVPVTETRRRPGRDRPAPAAGRRRASTSPTSPQSPRRWPGSSSPAGGTRTSWTGRRTRRRSRWPRRSSGACCPGSYTCETDRFTVAGWLEPANAVGGDTFDYSLDRDTLHLSVTDAVGNDVNAALLASVLLGSLRNSRRRGADLAEPGADGQRRARGARPGRAVRDGPAGPGGPAHRHDDLRQRRPPLPLPGPRRPGRARSSSTSTCPSACTPAATYGCDGCSSAPATGSSWSPTACWSATRKTSICPACCGARRATHPRELVYELAETVLHATGGELHDDATVLCLDWRGGPDEPDRPDREE